MGHLHDDFSLRALYNACDVMIVPSKQDNLPNTAIEAQTCGTPVVAFDIGGLSDIVLHKQTGFLAKAFDVEDLSTGIIWVLEQKENINIMARNEAVKRYSEKIIAQKYKDKYQELIL